VEFCFCQTTKEWRLFSQTEINRVYAKCKRSTNLNENFVPFEEQQMIESLNCCFTFKKKHKNSRKDIRVSVERHDPLFILNEIRAT